MIEDQGFHGIPRCNPSERAYSTTSQYSLGVILRNSVDIHNAIQKL